MSRSQFYYPVTNLSIVPDMELRETMISTVLRLLNGMLSLKTDVNVQGGSDISGTISMLHRRVKKKTF